MKLELAHDIIAQKIAEKVSVEDKQIRKINAFIKARFKVYSLRKTALLEKEDINYIQPFLEKLDLNSEEKKFLNTSIRNIRNKKIILIAVGISIISIIAAIGFTAIYLQSQSESYKSLLQEKERLLNEKGKEIELKSIALKDKLKEEEDLDERLSKIHTILENTKSEISESEKIVQEKNLVVQDADSILKKDNPTKIDFFRSEIAKTENWSDLLADADWETAKKKCQAIGKSLPNKLEWESVILKNQELVQKWKSERCCKYWTINSDSPDKASLIDINTGSIENIFKDNALPVRCIQ